MDDSEVASKQGKMLHICVVYLRKLVLGDMYVESLPLLIKYSMKRQIE